MKRLVLCVGLLVLPAGYLALRIHGAPPVLGVPAVTNGTVTLRLTGDPGVSYALKWSTNLSTWFDVGSGPAAGGLLTMSHAVPGPQAFYRGQQISGLQPYPTVGVGADTNLLVDGVLLPEKEGAVRLEAPSGTVFTLNVPSNSVVDATAVRMTLITNLTGFPAAQGFLAAVLLEPAGLIFQAPVMLRLDFPTNLISSQMASYSFDNDGTLLHLQPDLVSSNSVRIFVTQLAGYGCGVFTLAELQSLAATVPPSPPLSSGLSRMASLDECYPENVREANQLRADLTRKLRPIQQRTAAILGEARQKALLGVEEPGNTAIRDAFIEGDLFFETELVPRIPNAQTKLRVGQELLMWMLSFERQRQLLGVDSRMDVIAPFMCAVMAEGTREVIECCRTHGPDMRLVMDLLSMERQRQLLGLVGGECGGIDLNAAIQDCAPLWYGRLTVTESGSFTTNRSDASTLRTSSESYTYSLEAIALTNAETIVAPIPLIGFPGATNLTVKLGGVAKGAHVLNAHDKDLWNPCAGQLRPVGARLGRQDGGDAIEIYTLLRSSVSNYVELDLRAQFVGPGAMGMAPYLNFNVPFHSVPQQGSTTTTVRTPVAGGCDVSQTVQVPGQNDTYGGMSFTLAAGEFLFTTNRLFFQVTTNRTVGSLEVQRSVLLELQRRD